MSRAIYWFRNDLRVEDNSAFNKAIEMHEQLIPVYILDKDWLDGSQFGIEKIGVHRLKFLLESLVDLKNKLQQLDSNLHFAIGDPIEEIAKVRKEFNCSNLYGQKASAYNEEQQENELQILMPCTFLWGETLYHLDDLDFSLDALPEVFTQFRKAVEKGSEVRKELDIPLKLNSPGENGTCIPSLEELGFEEPETDERAVIQFKGGATAGLERL
ncbi:MAG: deoxyribodipyrimidine photo-lyase [Cytophagia bacterium]|nr:deoxyribodipyrimidine photo-lyase [Cytophagia bacterium]